MAARIGLTGGIGSGKSTVLAMLQARGAAGDLVINGGDLDPVAHSRQGRLVSGLPEAAEADHADPAIVYAEIDTAASAEARKKIPNLKNARDFSVEVARPKPALKAAS